MKPNYIQEKVKEISEAISKEIDQKVFENLSIENLLRLKDQIDGEVIKRESYCDNICILDQMILDDTKKKIEYLEQEARCQELLKSNLISGPVLIREVDSSLGGESNYDEENEYDDPRYNDFACEEEHDKRLEEEYLKDSYKDLEKELENNNDFLGGVIVNEEYTPSTHNGVSYIRYFSEKEYEGQQYDLIVVSHDVYITSLEFEKKFKPMLATREGRYLKL